MYCRYSDKRITQKKIQTKDAKEKEIKQKRKKSLSPSSTVKKRWPVGRSEVFQAGLKVELDSIRYLTSMSGKVNAGTVDKKLFQYYNSRDH